jgi:hypothetical protein
MGKRNYTKDLFQRMQTLIESGEEITNQKLFGDNYDEKYHEELKKKKCKERVVTIKNAIVAFEYLDEISSISLYILAHEGIKNLITADSSLVGDKDCGRFYTKNDIGKDKLYAIYDRLIAEGYKSKLSFRTLRIPDVNISTKVIGDKYLVYINGAKIIEAGLENQSFLIAGALCQQILRFIENNCEKYPSILHLSSKEAEVATAI